MQILASYSHFSDLGGTGCRAKQLHLDPADERQGLRLSGGFKLPRPFFGPPPGSTWRLRLTIVRWHCAWPNWGYPLGGRARAAYSIDAEEGNIPLRARSPPRYWTAPRLYTWARTQCLFFLVPQGELDEACTPHPQTAVLPR